MRAGAAPDAGRAARWLVPLFGLALLLGLSHSSRGGEPALPLRVGDPYLQARRHLLEAGLRRRHDPGASDCDGPLADRRCVLFEEIGGCSHTGMGLCRFNWTAPDGRTLAVITSGGTPAGDPGVVASWFYEPAVAPGGSAP